jgi:hypothetical protein
LVASNPAMGVHAPCVPQRIENDTRQIVVRFDEDDADLRSQLFDGKTDLHFMRVTSNTTAALLRYYRRNIRRSRSNQSATRVLGVASDLVMSSSGPNAAVRNTTLGWDGLVRAAPCHRPPRPATGPHDRRQPACGPDSCVLWRRVRDAM